MQVCAADRVEVSVSPVSCTIKCSERQPVTAEVCKINKTYPVPFFPSGPALFCTGLTGLPVQRICPKLYFKNFHQALSLFWNAAQNHRGAGGAVKTQTCSLKEFSKRNVSLIFVSAQLLQTSPYDTTQEHFLVIVFALAAQQLTTIPLLMLHSSFVLRW